MNFSIPKIWRKRNKPVRCHSRWRKTLQKRFTLGEILEASPKNPFMTVRWMPKTEEDVKLIERHQQLIWMSAIGIGPAMLLGPEKLQSLLESASK